MAFRDDREALRARSESLESDLGDARTRLSEAERELADREAQGSQDKEELSSLRAEVDVLRLKLGIAPQKKKVGSSARAFVGAMILLGSAGVSAYLLSARSESKRSTVAREAQAQAYDGYLAAERLAPARERSMLDVAYFGAVIISAEGLPIDAGTGCVIEAELHNEQGVAGLRMECADTVYSSHDMAGAEIEFESYAGEVQVNDEYIHRVNFRDVGIRTGPRPQIRLDTSAQLGRVFRDGEQPFDVHFYTDVYSAGRAGERLTRTAESAAEGGRLHLRAVEIERSGPAPEIPEQGCELRVQPDVGLPCRLLLRCGDAIVYGEAGTGYASCAQRGGFPDVADDEDPTASGGDPIMHLRFSDRQLLIADDHGGERWQLTFRLEEHSACNLDGRWSGVLQTERWRQADLHISDGRLTFPVADSMSYSFETELDCLSGEGVIVTSEGVRFEGRFGPGFATFLGRVRGSSEPSAFWLRRESPE